jgi:uncharacterized protein
MRTTARSVPTAAGDLRAIVWRPDHDELMPGVVLVDRALKGTAGDTWASLAGLVVECGAVAISHDKPGCGGSPGDWREQSLHDRAAESLAAAEVLRKQPGVDPDRVGLLGVSQGGWVSYLAASLAPEAIRHIVSLSGPAVTPFEQERYRIEIAVDADPEAMAWVDERTRRLMAGEDHTSIPASQHEYADRPWYQGACAYYDRLEMLPLLVRAGSFNPSPVLPLERCPVFAAFGGADDSTPVCRSVAVLSRLLPANPRHAIAVYPQADHGLQLDRQEGARLRDRLAPGFLPMLTA